MNIETLKNSVKLFIDGKLSGEEFLPIFEEFHSKYFDYYKFQKKHPELADLIEEINEDISRFEPIKELRVEHPDYYIDENGLRESVKRLLSYHKF